MGFTIHKEEAQDLLDKKRNLLGRGLSYAEKILFLHEEVESRSKILVRERTR